MNHLPLEVGVVHHIEVHQPNRAHARGGEVEREGRPQPARANQQHARRLEPPLPLHRDFGHNQVATVAQHLLLRERDGLQACVVDEAPHALLCAHAPCHRGHNHQFGIRREGRLQPLKVAHILLAQIEVHKAAQLPLLVEQVRAQLGIGLHQLLNRFADRAGVHSQLRLLVGEHTQRRWDKDGWHTHFLLFLYS
ncbi:hypothetical protein HRbin14_02079 [bacterium HR14]|nr:hypothetical protein HRbin14_02079 [bacterium HR14]